MASEIEKASLEQKEDDAPLVFDGNEQDLLVDGYQGVSFNNGILRFNLFQNRFKPGEEPDAQRVVIARLCLSMQAFLSIHVAFSGLIERMKSEGIIKEAELDLELDAEESEKE